MTNGPAPTPQIAAVPATTPFVAPEELARRVGHGTLLRLGANESAFGPPPRALEAMGRELARTSWYGDPESTELRSALAARHACSPEQITVASGIDDILGLIVRAYLGVGELALTTRGTYPTFAFHVSGYGGRLETVPYADGGSVPLDELSRRARELRPKIVYLANPDNPSGTFHARHAVEAFFEAVPPETLVLLDEAYADFVAAGDLPSGALRRGVVRARTFSKAYGMAGARIGYLLGTNDVVATLQKIRLHFGVNRTAQIGAQAALEDDGFVEWVAGEVARGREQYAQLGRRFGLATLRSRTNFVCFDAGSRERADALVAELLRAGVFIRKPGAPPLDRYVRVTVGNAEERLRFGEALGVALAALDAKAGAWSVA